VTEGCIKEDIPRLVTEGCIKEDLVVVSGGEGRDVWRVGEETGNGGGEGKGGLVEGSTSRQNRVRYDILILVSVSTLVLANAPVSVLLY